MTKLLRPEMRDAAVLPHRLQLRRVEVRAGPALAERERADRLAGGEPRQHLCRARAAAGRDRRRGDGVHEEDHPGRRACRADGLARLCQRRQRAAGAAVLHRDDEPERARLGEGAQALRRVPPLPVDAGGLRRNLLLGDLTDRAEHNSKIVAHDRCPFGR